MHELRDRIAAGLGERGLAVERQGRVVMRAGVWLPLAVLYAHYRPIKGAVRWFGQYHAQPKPHWMLFARLNEAKSAVRDYCLIRGGITNIWLDARHRDGRYEERYEEGVEPLLDRLAEIARAHDAPKRHRRARRAR